MALSKLRTDWVCIGSSGPTIDGRKIEADWLSSMAETYDPTRYAALIWRDHNRYDWWNGTTAKNMGKVEALRVEDNADGGVNLMAILSPNEEYIYENRNGQYLYTSIEITENFPESGLFYLSGLGATDSPASARTSEIRFSAQSKSVIFGATAKVDVSSRKDKEPGWLNSWLRGGKHRYQPEEYEESAMDKEMREALTQFMTSLGEKLDMVFEAVSKPPVIAESIASEIKVATPEQFAALETKIAGFETKIAGFETRLAEAEKKPAGVTAETFASLKKTLDDLSAAFTNALGEEHPDGTKPPEQKGDGLDIKAFL